MSWWMKCMEKWDYVVCMKCCWNVILSFENKSLTNAEEPWEIKILDCYSRVKSMHIFRPCFRMFPLGIPTLLFEKNSVGEYWIFLRETLWRVLIPAWGKEFRSLSCPFLYWRVISWLERIGVNNLLGIKKLTVIWFDFQDLQQITGDYRKVYWGRGVVVPWFVVVGEENSSWGICNLLGK